MPDQTPIASLTAAEAREALLQNQFEAGTMLPKIEAGACFCLL